MINRWRAWARRLQQESYALFVAYRDPRLGWPVRLLAAAVAVYALSPIDLIPDVIPVLGYLDDLIIVPLGVALVIRMVPAEVMREARQEAAERMADDHPHMRAGAVAIVVVWLLVALLLLRYASSLLASA